MTDITGIKQQIEEKLNQFSVEATKMRTEWEKLLVKYSKQGYKIDTEKIQDFLDNFWHVCPTKNQNEWEIIVPVCIPFSVGFWDRTDKGYNVFIINKYTRWFGEEVPLFISHQIALPSTLPIVVDGEEAKFPEEYQDKIGEKFGEHFSLIEKDHAKVKQGHEFKLLAEIIEAGSLPFPKRQVSAADLQESDFTQLYDEIKNTYHPLKLFEGEYSFQGDAYRLFEKYGAIGVFWGMSFGKTVLGAYIFSTIKGKKCLVVPTRTLKEHWEQFFKWNCPRLLNEVEILTYQGMSRKTWRELSKKEFVVIGFDECHMLPADTFSKLATLKTKYRFGLSATPYREDGRTNYIMALTGYPTGVDWRTIMRVLGKDYHTVNVHVVKDLVSKYVLVKELYNPERKTLIFVNLLAIGDKISSMLEIPFIHGQTKNRLKVVKESPSFVASRVMELGVSIKDLEHIIEVDFLFGSRREEVQRTGRLMHSIAKGKIHDIIMTKDEYDNYGKRLWGLFEKGFRYRLVPHLTGIKSIHEEKTKKVFTRKADINIVEKLYKEGFFQIERTFREINTEIEKRGGKLMASVLFNRLDSMVRQEKLFKIKKDGGYRFQAR